MRLSHKRKVALKRAKWTPKNKISFSEAEIKQHTLMFGQKL